MPHHPIPPRGPKWWQLALGCFAFIGLLDEHGDKLSVPAELLG
jgi:hypothetical protein